MFVQADGLLNNAERNSGSCAHSRGRQTSSLSALDRNQCVYITYIMQHSMLILIGVPGSINPGQDTHRTRST